MCLLGVFFVNTYLILERMSVLLLGANFKVSVFANDRFQMMNNGVSLHPKL